MRYTRKEDIEAAKRVRRLVANHWPVKDMVVKLIEEGVEPLASGSKWSVRMVKEAIELSRHLLDHDESAAWLDELNATQWRVRGWIDRLPTGAREAALQSFYEVEKRLKAWGVKEASDLGDGESLRRLQPGDEHLYILARIATPKDDEKPAGTIDPDDHVEWSRRRNERARKDLN